MAKLNRLGWAAGTCFDAYGVRIGIRANSLELLEKLPEHLPPGWKPASSPVVDHLYSFRGGGRPRSGLHSYNLLYSGVGRLARTMDLTEAYEVLEADLRQHVVGPARGAGSSCTLGWWPGGGEHRDPGAQRKGQDHTGGGVAPRGRGLLLLTSSP